MSQQGHDLAAAVLRLRKAVCVPGGAGTDNHKYHTFKQLGVTVDPRCHVTAAISCCLEMALWRNTLDGGPSVSDNNWRVVSITQQIINEFPGMWTKSACCLKNERDQIDVWVPVKFGLFLS